MIDALKMGFNQLCAMQQCFVSEMYSFCLAVKVMIEVFFPISRVESVLLVQPLNTATVSKGFAGTFYDSDLERAREHFHSEMENVGRDTEEGYLLPGKEGGSETSPEQVTVFIVLKKIGFKMWWSKCSQPDWNPLAHFYCFHRFRSQTISRVMQRFLF